MNYTMTTPCPQCPFLKKHSHAYSMRRLTEFASGAFPCHKSADEIDCKDGGTEFHANGDSVHCAGALIFLEKRDAPNQMMRICELLGMYDRTKLDMKADVR